MIKPQMVDGGAQEWADVSGDDTAWAQFEKATSAIVQATGTFTAVHIFGSLFGDAAPYEIARLTPASPMEMIAWLPTYVRPVVDGAATIRLKARG